MPRKFRLVNVKNGERKKRAQRMQLSQLSQVPSPLPSFPADPPPTLSPRQILQQLHASLGSDNIPWSDQTPNDFSEIRLCKIAHSSSSCQPMVISKSLIVHDDLTWEVFVHGHKVENLGHTPLSSIPTIVDVETLSKLFRLLDTAVICPGNPDERFIEMAAEHTGNFSSMNGTVTAIVEDGFQVLHNGQFYTSTIRTVTCDLLVHGNKCQSCHAYRSQLRAMHSRWSHKKATPHKYTNNRYLSTPQKEEKIQGLQARAFSAEKEVQRLRNRLVKCTEEHGVSVDTNLHTDLHRIMEEKDDEVQKLFPQGSFRLLFWEEQLKAARVKDARQMRWHPMMVRWCLNLKLLSSSSYHALRTSGFIKLPSERTLRDYTHFIKSEVGFQAEVEKMLVEEAKLDQIPEWKKHIVLVLDEMKLKESLVYDKHEAKVLGFVNLGSVNDELVRFEQNCSSDEEHSLPIANHMLVLMVRGIFTHLRFPYAHFPTANISGDFLFLIVWEAIERLEKLGFKVIVVTGDGASPNRKFFHMHSTTRHLCYKTKNPYTDEERCVFFMSDVPHLIKTTRNCWSHSFGHGNRRKLWINGHDISWQHLVRLYEAKLSMGQRSDGLYLLQKLSLEHIQLNSYSRMRVDLAAQVLSESVANAFQFYGDPRTSETERFVRTFDKLFDCLNVRSRVEHKRRKKPNLKPFYSSQDERLSWLERDFLGYLDQWQTSVNSRQDIAEAEKATMCLSKETLEGLHITVKSFVEVVRYLLTIPGVQGQYILSECFSQDPLENYFGQVRARGGRCENPTAKACLETAQSLRVQGSLALQPVRGNSSRKRRLFPGPEKIINDPLPKRPRQNKSANKENH